MRKRRPNHAGNELAPHSKTDRNGGRSRGGAGLGTLSLRPLPSAGDRGPRTEIERLRGELAEPEIPVAHPVPRELEPVVGSDGVTHRLVVEHVYEPQKQEPVEQERRGPSGPVMVAILAMCLLAAVVFVVFALSIAGKLNGTPTPWKQDQVHQQQHRPGR